MSQKGNANNQSDYLRRKQFLASESNLEQSNCNGVRGKCVDNQSSVIYVPGTTGPTGSTGSTGPAGQDGVIGRDGETGPTGSVGPAGPAGPAGSASSTGAKGETGSTGSTGSTGPTGSTGSTGSTGLNGPALFTLYEKSGTSDINFPTSNTVSKLVGASPNIVLTKESFQKVAAIWGGRSRSLCGGQV